MQNKIIFLAIKRFYDMMAISSLHSFFIYQ